MRLVSVIVIAIVFCTCSSSPSVLKTGQWRGVITIQGHALPFTFKVFKNDSAQINVNLMNAGEKILLDEVSFTGDSVVMTLHIFDAILQAKIEGDSLKGFFIKNYEKDYKLPFKAAYNQNFRFVDSSAPTNTDFSGKYAVTFLHDADTTKAIGIFKQHNNHVEGTFLTPTGDYRYLDGSVINDTMYLSTFDGNYAYLFTAQKNNDGTLHGDYWSGKSWHESWVGINDNKASLPDAESLTYLKAGFDQIDFNFPDVSGKIISPLNKKYENKVLILQLFGTWCPNCLDETKFLAPWYDQNRKRGVEIIGLAYERKDNFEYASSRVKKMKEKLLVHYDFVIGGTADKIKAAETLPMLNTVVAFPTTIFVGKDGKVKKIHTGFSGPGTGPYYNEFIQRFNETVNQLLAE